MARIRAAAVAVAVLAATALTACRFSSVEDEPVSLADVRDAYVVSGGAERAAADGDTLEKGDGVVTRPGGSVALVVRGRRVVLGGDTRVVVPDGATVDVTRGSLLVDRRRGPGVTIHAADTTIDNVGSGALRVEKSFSVLVAGLSTGARVRTTTGPRLDLEALYQVVVAGRSLPRTGLPLQLRRDAWEEQTIADVLRDDERLNDLAEGLEGPGAPVVPASYTATPGTKVTDLVLADAIGRAAAKDEPGRRSAASRARMLRTEGGSWGVVAHLLDASVVDVGTALSEVLRGVPASSADGSPTASPTQGGVVAGGTPQPGVSPTPSPGRPTRTKGPDDPPRPTEEPTSTTGSPDPLAELISSIPSPLVPLR